MRRKVGIPSQHHGCRILAARYRHFIFRKITCLAIFLYDVQTAMSMWKGSRLPLVPTNSHDSFLLCHQRISHVSGSRIAVAVLALFMLGACATSPQGRSQLTVPAPVSDAYSEVDMRIRLVMTGESGPSCLGTPCDGNQQFNERVQRLGARLAAAAFDMYPDLRKRVNQFSFSVADKTSLGSASTGSGKIVIFRGVQNLGVRDEVLALLLAREMGHVIGRHHDENSATRLLFSVLAGILFPATNLFNGSTAAAQATSVTSTTTLTTTAATTATSLVGSQIVLASVKPMQLSEADAIALALVEALGWSRHEIIAALKKDLVLTEQDGWSKDMRASMENLAALDTSDEVEVATLNNKEHEELASEVGENVAPPSVEETVATAGMDSLITEEMAEPWAETAKIELAANSQSAIHPDSLEKNYPTAVPEVRPTEHGTIVAVQRTFRQPRQLRAALKQTKPIQTVTSRATSTKSTARGSLKTTERPAKSRLVRLRPAANSSAWVNRISTEPRARPRRDPARPSSKTPLAQSVAWQRKNAVD
ncbi:MAG: M48 family metalloprotease [Methylophilaceae bacterium]|nr:M48 family metalloprotease [Methylophilaceae bacterium]